jgi:2-polyprenyl-3-methyl-5-hydroxy-6-metoxy-1,4-benzoquinol methylase
MRFVVALVVPLTPHVSWLAEGRSNGRGEPADLGGKLLPPLRPVADRLTSEQGSRLGQDSEDQSELKRWRLVQRLSGFFLGEADKEAMSKATSSVPEWHLVPADSRGVIPGSREEPTPSETPHHHYGSLKCVGPPTPRMAAQIERLESETTWDRRHRELGLFTSRGDRGSIDHDTQALYFTRLGQLLTVIGPYSSATAPLEVLDAGCGEGFFSESLARCGHQVVAFDPSAAALASVSRPPMATYRQSTIEQFHWPGQFDVVCAIDVLPHIRDHDEWAESVRSLASFVRFPGQLIIIDPNEAPGKRSKDFMEHRSSASYLALLNPSGFRLASKLEYLSPDNLNWVHVYENSS